ATANVIIVHSQEIDDSGEVGLGIRTFDGTLRDLRAAWHHLQAAGVKHFVFTADHGFLLQDETTQVRPYGTKRDPSRRHIYSEQLRAEAGMAHVSLASLGYDNAPGYLLFQEDTAVYATGAAGATFVHGGNSPEERIIPVLVVRRKTEAATGTATYAVEAKAERDLAGMRCIKARLLRAQTDLFGLTYAGASQIDLALRVVDRPDVRVSLKDARGAELTKSGRLRAPVGDAWAEVYFTIEGPRDEKVRVEVYTPDAVERVVPASPDELFAVDVSIVVVPVEGAAPPPAVATTWLDALPQEYRGVFSHLADHGSVTEEELVRMLGAARKARAFALAFDGLAKRAPFQIRIEQAGAGKRYVREEER
ncbi:MAG TPA: BREX-6 system phosphatase PglZ, partial [Polyangiaceae bacterium]